MRSYKKTKVSKTDLIIQASFPTEKFGTSSGIPEAAASKSHRDGAYPALCLGIQGRT